VGEEREREREREREDKREERCVSKQSLHQNIINTSTLTNCTVKMSFHSAQRFIALFEALLNRKYFDSAMALADLERAQQGECYELDAT
jgi:hypothetical protein